MCGIYGRLERDGEIARSAYDQLAIGRLRHRGPDDEGLWYGRRCVIGMRRLSVIDLVSGHQPMSSPDGAIQVVFNGEIYNFMDVRRELESRGHHFITHSDTEVIVHGYLEWGEGVFDRLNGMFAVAIWDERSAALLLVRDRLGVKPLYVFEDASRLIFASEIKSILAHPDVRREIEPKGLLNYFAYGHAVGEDTIYRGIRKLLPGHLLRAAGGRVEVRPWWNPVPGEPTRMSQAECAAEVRRLLEDSVRLRMIADVPLGAFLSGGLDSSAVVAIMTRQMNRPVDTFSIGFDFGAEFNELPDARRVSQHCGTNHHEVVVRAPELVDTLQTLVYHFDEPFGDAACFPTYLVSRLARQHVTVALTGEGGDELFGGYRRYPAARWLRRLRLLSGGLAGPVAAPLVASLPRFRRIKKLVEVARIPDDAARYAGMLRVFTDDLLNELLEPGFDAALRAYDAVAPYRRYFEEASGADELNQFMYVDMKTWLADTYLEKVDKTTMAVSLEARVPLLDYRLVEFAMSIPSSYKFSGGVTKKVLRDAVRDLLPPRTMAKPKHGFAVPTDPWFRGELKQFAYDVLLDGRTRQRGLVNAASVERLWRAHQDGREVRDSHLWLLLNFELWARQYLDARVAA
ncbi:MAG TPA: asparagine synthase (glutamine-hydrolyzing) [Vicinamibacterales bacterium]|nr:asparagine synthase (glutamine-hydrolyzing) [Vicinamibacterales bacterium]